jgi:hypothetical protein
MRFDRANLGGDQTVLKNIIERAADPRDFASEPERLRAVIDYLNVRLFYDGLELQRVGPHVRLGTPSRPSSVVDALVTAAAVIDFDTANRDLERALASAENDPEDAVTSALLGHRKRLPVGSDRARICRRRRTSRVYTRPYEILSRRPDTKSKKSCPSSAVLKTNVEVRKTGGLTAPSDSCGS